jgi:hypothetical protein
MKWLWLTLIVVMTSCTNKSLRCDGAPRPINAPVTGAQHRQ